MANQENAIFDPIRKSRRSSLNKKPIQTSIQPSDDNSKKFFSALPRNNSASRSTKISAREDRQFSFKQPDSYTTKSNYCSAEMPLRRPISASCDQRPPTRGKARSGSTTTKQSALFSPSFVQPKTPAPDSLSTSSREKKNEHPKNNEDYTILYPEGMETLSFLTLAAQKHREFIQMLQYKHTESQTKDSEGDCNDNPSNSTENSQLSDQTNATSPDRRSSTALLEKSYYSALEETSHVWTSLLYFILNLRVNLIKILNKTRRETFVPNVAVERDILSRAIECVNLFSILKIKSLSDELDRNRSQDKSGPELTKNRDLTLSSLVSETNYMETKAREIVGRLKRVNEKRIKT